MMPSKIRSALAVAIRHRVPFVCCQLPGDDTPAFFADPEAGRYTGPSKSSCPIFIAADFNKEFYPPLAIRPVMDADAVGAFDWNTFAASSAYVPYARSTPYDEYTTGVEGVINRLVRDGGKTVISRVVCSSGGHHDWSAVVTDYFTRFPSCFRFCFYHPLSGFWIGATPELLLDCDITTGRFSTMSLAGTRPLSAGDAPWDEKNIREHDMVTRYIADTLDNLGITYEVSAATNLRYGAVEHLCHHITGCVGEVSPISLLNTLSPTPALAGYPLQSALADIASVERHPRLMYGGYAGLIYDDRMQVFVNIRCANFDNNGYCIYGGGGITAQSSSASEWNEAEAKMAPLRDVIERHKC